MGFHIPKVADVLPRPRLYRLLENYDHCSVVLVTGQAAQGKSTLVADFLQGRDDQCLWFHMNRSASDHGVLFETLVRGIRQWGDLPEEFSFPPHITLGTREDLLRQIEILVLLLSQAERPLNIILDDLEALEDTAAAGTAGSSAFDFIERLIRESPDSIRFFLLSRARPRINLSRLKMEKQVLTLTNSDLAFTLDEASAFFRFAGGQTGYSDGMGQGDVKKILDITDGWAGGLVLVSESIRQSHDLDQLPDRLTSEAFSYFSGEIYHTLTPEIRAFLMKSALFDELDTRILSAFFKDMDPIAILRRLEKRNLFIRKINANSQWPVFKYNNLFRDFLKADLLDTFGADQVLALNKKAGDIFWDKKEHEKAIICFMKARSHNDIARIIRIKGADYVINGQAQRLAEWIKALPEGMTQEDPWLVFFATMARRIKGGKKNITAFGQALDLFKQKDDTRGCLLCIAYLIEASVFIRQPSQVILKWIREGERALTDLKGKHRFTWARTLLWQQIGLGYIAGNGDIPKGISACRNAVLLAQRIENQDLVLNASVILTLGFVQSGDFAGAREMLEKIQTMTQEGHHPEYRALKNIANADLALKRGNLTLADQLLSKSEADIEKFGLIFLYPGVVEARALYLAQMGQFAQAVQTADHLSDFSILEGNDFYLGISHRIKAMCHLRQGRYEEASESARSAIKDLDQSRRGDIHLSLARQILGFSLFHLDKIDQAIAELEDVLTYFMGIGADLNFCETALVLGVLWDAKTRDAKTGDAKTGDDQPIEPANGWFKAGVEKVVGNRYHNFPLLDRKTLARALVLACKTRVLSNSDLVGYFTGFRDNDLLSAVKNAICDCLERTAKKQQAARAEQLRPLYKMTRPRVVIHTLGPFTVHINEKILDPSVFGGAKPLLLLKAIVLNGGRDIPKEVLIDALWPSATTTAGEKNFKINLHRLRKALEPSPVKAFGHVYLSQKTGRVSLDPDLVSIDTKEFMSLTGKAKQHEEKEQLKRALGCYSRALAIYRGDYFADDPYLEWIGPHRDLYRLKCMEILAGKAGIHEELTQWQEAIDAWQAILALDSCNEKAFQNLMILYADAGLKSDALHVFARCKAVLKSELDTEPDASTFEIYNRIIAG